MNEFESHPYQNFYRTALLYYIIGCVYLKSTTLNSM